MPLSPVISTVSGVPATCAIRARSSFITALEPIITFNRIGAVRHAGAGVEQPTMLDRPRDQSFELIDIERFFDVIKRPVPHRFDGRSDRGMGSDHQNLRPCGRRSKWRMNSKPDMPGICKSVTMTSKHSLSNCTSASLPLATHST